MLTTEPDESRQSTYQRRTASVTASGTPSPPPKSVTGWSWWLMTSEVRQRVPTLDPTRATPMTPSMSEDFRVQIFDMLKILLRQKRRHVQCGSASVNVNKRKPYTLYVTTQMVTHDYFSFRRRPSGSSLNPHFFQRLYEEPEDHQSGKDPGGPLQQGSGDARSPTSLLSCCRCLTGGTVVPWSLTLSNNTEKFKIRNMKLHKKHK